MNAKRVAAGVLALVDSFLGLYTGYAFPTPGGLLIGLSVILLVDSLLCLYGIRLAFLVGAVLSVLLPGGATLSATPMGTTQYILLALSLVSMAANIVAFRSTTHLSEQANPMNLPVFG